MCQHLAGAEASMVDVEALAAAEVVEQLLRQTWSCSGVFMEEES
eukprot:SAG11_NODE_15_length_26319_cov_13.810564_7_plen_44_part_00